MNISDEKEYQLDILVSDDLEEELEVTTGSLIFEPKNYFIEDRRLIALSFFNVYERQIVGQVIEEITQKRKLITLAIIDHNYAELDSDFVRESGFDVKIECTKTRGRDLQSFLNELNPKPVIWYHTAYSRDPDVKPSFKGKIEDLDFSQKALVATKGDQGLYLTEGMPKILKNCTKLILSQLSKSGLKSLKKAIKEKDYEHIITIENINKKYKLKYLLGFALRYNKNSSNNEILSLNIPRLEFDENQVDLFFNEYFEIQNYKPKGVFASPHLLEIMDDYVGLKNFEFWEEEIKKEVIKRVIEICKDEQHTIGFNFDLTKNFQKVNFDLDNEVRNIFINSLIARRVSILIYKLRTTVKSLQRVDLLNIVLANLKLGFSVDTVLSSESYTSYFTTMLGMRLKSNKKETIVAQMKGKNKAETLLIWTDGDHIHPIEKASLTNILSEIKSLLY
ncbi:hypothetical protein [Emticicia sp. SJ17W-69]|uniref:hypothetical protein n=1 Tax=Emticicia sp. SJ17W-69 TaxID=3421657 RepID=UPI003EB7CB35